MIDGTLFWRASIESWRMKTFENHFRVIFWTEKREYLRWTNSSAANVCILKCCDWIKSTNLFHSWRKFACKYFRSSWVQGTARLGRKTSHIALRAGKLKWRTCCVGNKSYGKKTILTRGLGLRKQGSKNAIWR